VAGRAFGQMRRRDLRRCGAQSPALSGARLPARSIHFVEPLKDAVQFVWRDAGAVSATETNHILVFTQRRSADLPPDGVNLNALCKRLDNTRQSSRHRPTQVCRAQCPSRGSFLCCARGEKRSTCAGQVHAKSVRSELEWHLAGLDKAPGRGNSRPSTARHLGVDFGQHVGRITRLGEGGQPAMCLRASRLRPTACATRG